MTVAEQARTDLAHVEQVTASASPHGQVRAMAHLLGLRPALSSCACSRIAAAAGRESDWAGAFALLVRRGVGRDIAVATADLLWEDR
jgi:hypothetical protein